MLYHAVLDGVLVFCSGIGAEWWLNYLIMAAILLPGWIWGNPYLARGRTGEQRHVVTPLRVEWSAFLTSLKKELIQQWRSKRLLVVMAVFILFGLSSPLLAYFTPEIMKSIPGAEQFANLIPEPSVKDALGQYVKNLNQFGFILAILLGMSAVVSEKEQGTAALILSKPLPRWAFILSKFCAQVLVYLAAFLVAMLGAYYYILILFGSFDFGLFALLNLIIFVWLMTFVGVTLVGSVVGNSTGAAAGIGFGLSLVLMLSGYIPMYGQLGPGGLSNWAGQIAALPRRDCFYGWKLGGNGLQSPDYHPVFAGFCGGF